MSLINIMAILGFANGFLIGFVFYFALKGVVATIKEVKKKKKKK